MIYNEIESKQCSSNNSGLSEKDKSLQILTRQMCKTRVFLGDFTERRYVNSLKQYRDVIVVNNNEIELINDLQDVYRRLYQHYALKPNFWIGISEKVSDAVQRLWVEIPNVPFGKYWFTIRNVKFRENEVILRVKILREVSTVDAESILNIKTKTYNFDDYVSNYKETSKQNILYFFDEILTVKNIGKLLQFIAAILFTSLAGGFEAIKFLSDFMIKFIRELTVFIRTATPIFIAVIDFFSKVVGGFYILLSMMWRGKDTSKVPQLKPYAIGDARGYQRQPNLKNNPQSHDYKYYAIRDRAAWTSETGEL